MIVEPGKNICFSRHILHQHWHTCPIALPLRRNPQHRSLLIVVSATSAPPFQPLHHQRNVCHQVVNRFTRQTLPTANRKHVYMNIRHIESFCPQKAHNRTLLFGSTLLKHGPRYDYWNQRLNMRMRVYYLNCHEAGLCCYLVIHIRRKRITSIYDWFTDYLHSWLVWARQEGTKLVLLNYEYKKGERFLA
jgi:hypothetical protein